MLEYDCIFLSVWLTHTHTHTHTYTHIHITHTHTHTHTRVHVRFLGSALNGRSLMCMIVTLSPAGRNG